MKNEDVKWGSIFLLAIGMVLLLCAWLAGGVAVSEDDYLSLSGDWNLQINDKAYGQVSLDSTKFPVTQKGDEVILSCILPDAQMESPELEFVSVHSVVKIYLGDSLLYSYGEGLYQDGKMLGYGSHLVDLPEEYAGQTLKICLTVSENGAFSSIDIPQICNGKRYIRNFLYQNRIPLLISMFLALFGLCVGALSGVGLLLKSKMLRLFCAGMFSFFIGLWSLANYNLLIIFTDNLRYKTIIEYVSLYLAPIFILLYFWDDAMRADRSRLWRGFYGIVLGLQCLFAAVSIAGQCLNVLHFPQMLRCQHILILAIVVWTGGILVDDILHRGVKQLTLFCGTVVMVVFSVADLSRFYIQKYFSATNLGSYQGLICVGTLLFTIALIIRYIEEIMGTLYQSAEQQTLEKLAYTDALTGLANRRKCEEVFDELDEKEQDYVLIEFDLNHLKKVNDTLGHEAGDAFIAAFGACLLRVYGQYGLVSRTGGDEFLIIIKDGGQFDAENAKECLLQEIAHENERHPAWDMSTAYGMCSLYVDKIRPVRRAYKVADERMYENKMEMKQKAGIDGCRV